jgi:hypothetical protein
MTFVVGPMNKNALTGKLLFEDQFTNATVEDFTTHTPDTDLVGNGWQEYSATNQLSSWDVGGAPDIAVYDGSTSTSPYYGTVYFEAGEADVFFVAEHDSTRIFLGANTTGDPTYTWAVESHHDATRIRITEEQGGGTWTVRASNTSWTTGAAGDEVGIMTIGDTVRLIYNGVEELSYTVASRWNKDSDKFAIQNDNSTANAYRWIECRSMK